MIELRKGFDAQTNESLFAEGMYCLAASAAERATTRACDGTGGTATLI